MSGFELYREDGRLVISSRHPQYSLIKVIRGGGDTPPFYGNFWDSSGRRYTDGVIVAFKSVAQNQFSSYRFSRNRTILRYPSAQPPAGATLSMHSGVLCDAYIFDVAQPQDVSNNFGLVVYNEAGEITFNTSTRYLKVAGVCNGLALTAANPWVEDGGISRFTFDRNADIAIVPLKEAYDIQHFANAGETLYGITWWATFKGGASTQIVYENEDYSGRFSGAYSHLPFSFLAIDVTGVPT